MVLTFHKLFVVSPPIPLAFLHLFFFDFFSSHKLDEGKCSVAFIRMRDTLGALHVLNTQIAKIVKRDTKVDVSFECMYLVCCSKCHNWLISVRRRQLGNYKIAC